MAQQFIYRYDYKTDPEKTPKNCVIFSIFDIENKVGLKSFSIYSGEQDKDFVTDIDLDNYVGTESTIIHFGKGYRDYQNMLNGYYKYTDKIAFVILIHDYMGIDENWNKLDILKLGELLLPM